MNILFRLDASKGIGNGHLIRCICLADRLRDIGAKATFLCRAEEEDDYDILIKSEHKLKLLKNKNSKDVQSYDSWLGVHWEQDAEEVKSFIDCLDDDINLIIVDHYGIDARWHKKLRASCKQIFVIDDLVDRELDCDFLLNSSFSGQVEEYSKLLLNKKCKSFLGPDYALISPKYNHLRSKALIKRKNNTSINEILVFLGSMDPKNYSGLAIEAIQSFQWRTPIEVNCILSSKSPSLELVRKQIVTLEDDRDDQSLLDSRASNQYQPEFIRPKITLHSDTENMEKFIFDADLCIGSGGNSAWERCVLGLPTFLTSIADNQIRNIQNITEKGAADFWKSKIDLLDLFKNYIQNTEKLKLLEENAFNLCDGQGIERITSSMMKDISR